MVILALTALVFSTNVVGAQAPAEVWWRPLGNTGSELIRDLAVDATGNVIVGGLFGSTTVIGGDTLTSIGGIDVFVAKVSPSGNVLWTWTAGGQWDDDLWGIASSGNRIFIAANIADSTLFNDTVPALRMFVACLDANGRYVWHQQPDVPDSGVALVRDIAANKTAVVVTGYLTKTALFRGFSLESSGGSDVLIVQYDTLGTPIWGKTAGASAGEETGFSIAVGYAAVHVSGSAYGTLPELDECTRISINPLLWIGQISLSGVPIRESCINDSGAGSNTSLIWDMLADAHDDLLIAGSFHGPFRDSTIGPDAETQVVLARLDSNHNVLWAIPSGTDRVDDVSIGASISVDERRRIHLSRWNVVDEIESTILEGFDLAGHRLYSTPVIGTGPLAADSAGSLYLGTGHVLSKFDLSSVPVSTSNTDPLLPDDRLLLNYPNPVRRFTTFYFQLETSAEVSLRLFDILGREVALITRGVMSAGKHTVRWRRGTLPSGPYLYSLETPTGVRMGSLILVE